MAGVDIRTIGDLLGHKSLAMTMHNVHLAPQNNAAAIDKFVQHLAANTGISTNICVAIAL